MGLQISWNMKGKIYTAIMLGIFFWPIAATIITKNVWYIAFVFWLLMVFGGVFGKSWKNVKNEMHMDILRIIFICIGSWLIIFAILQFGCPYATIHTENYAMCRNFPI